MLRRVILAGGVTAILAAGTTAAAVVLASAASVASGGTDTSRARVAFVTDIVSSDPHDFRSAAYRGFLRAVKEFRLKGTAVQVNWKQGPSATLALLGRRGYDLVVVLDIPP